MTIIKNLKIVAKKIAKQKAKIAKHKNKADALRQELKDLVDSLEFADDAFETGLAELEHAIDYLNEQE